MAKQWGKGHNQLVIQRTDIKLVILQPNLDWILMAQHKVMVYADGVNLKGNDNGTIERNAYMLLNAYKDTSLAVNIGKTNCKKA